jgi:hypothetical protein
MDNHFRSHLLCRKVVYTACSVRDIRKQQRQSAREADMSARLSLAHTSL